MRVFSPVDRRHQPRQVRGARFALGALAVGALAVVLSACGTSTALGNAVLAPLSALPQTDVILETNLQSAVEAAQAQGGLQAISAISGAAEAGGLPETSGPPTAPGVISVASAAGVSIYTAFNPADQHCLGTVVLASGSLTTVLGESTPGTYDFWFGPTTASNCTAADFSGDTTVPSGWATGDPSATGWPGT